MTTEKLKKIHDVKKNTAQSFDEDKVGEARLKGISQEKAFTDAKDVAEKLAACNASIQEWQDKYVRLSADLENFKRRIEKEQQLWREVAQTDLLLKLLTIVDNFDRAMAHKAESAEEIEAWVDGIKMIYGSLGEFLRDVGVKEVPYNRFDPSYHDALMQVESDKHTAGDIVMVIEKGYMLGDRVIRPAKVSVAQ